MFKRVFFWFAALALVLASWRVAVSVGLVERATAAMQAPVAWQADWIRGLLAVIGLSLPVLLWLANRRLRQSLLALCEAEARSRSASRQDALTGLFNRSVLSETVNAFIADARDSGGSLAVVLLDLDRFRTINDLRGIDVGDEVLQEVANRLCLACRMGQIPFRLGSDEFAVVVREGSEYDMATGLAQRIQNSMDVRFVVGEGEVSVGASIGIAVWREGLDAFQLLRHADQAMYRAKAEGRGRLNVFDDDLGERLREAAELEAELTEAIACAEIVPFFQPIVDISERRLVGFEVLARWHHARLGQIPPLRFISLAEDTGQINAISWLILRQACETARDWPDFLSISFNLSPKQFRDSELAGTISAVLQETGFPPERLEIEITETAVIEDLEYAREAIEQLRWLGIRISLDDFGTGFSSLATLSRLPFDNLKIDRSFVSKLTSDAQKAKIVAGIISLADSLDLSVTAEGIETEETFEMLAELKCELGQGYLFERPLPGREIDRLLASGRMGGRAGGPDPADGALARPA